MADRVYGYARVSTREQNLDRQMDALSAFGVEEEGMFADKASGKDFARPAYRRLLVALEPGDVLVIKSIDRLGRNYEEILDEWRIITRVKGTAIVVLDMPLLDTRREHDGVTGMLIADIVLQLLSYVAQVAKPARYREVKASYLRGKMTRLAAAEQLGVCVSTFDRWIKDDRAMRSSTA